MTIPAAPNQSHNLATVSSVRPPDLGMVKVKGNLQIYIASLKRWARIGGVKAELQGDVVMMHASSDYPELYLELETELGEKILNNPNAITMISDSLEKRFGVNKQADLMQSFSKFIGTKRSVNQDLLSYVAAFENSYSEFKKLGESLSDVFLALFMLSNANLPDTDFQIITANIDFEKARLNAVNVYEDMKAALRKYQYTKTVNQKPLKTLLTEANIDEEVSEDMVQEFKVYMASKKKHNNDGKNYTNDRPFVKRCWKCRCKCPKFEPCDCECTKHPHWKCKSSKPSKRRDEDSEEKDKSPKKTKLTAYCSRLEENLGFHKVLLIEETKSEECYNVEKVNVELTSQSVRDEQHMSTIDTGSPSNIIGVKTFKELYETYPKAIALQFKFEPSEKKFEFGGGEITKSLGRVSLPIYIRDDHDRLHMIVLRVEVVECDIIFLLGAESLEKAGAIFDIANSSLTLKKAVGKDISFPVLKHNSGHFRLPFYVMTEELMEMYTRLLVM